MEVNVEATFLFVVTDPPTGIFFGRSACVVNWRIVGKKIMGKVSVFRFLSVFLSCLTGLSCLPVPM